MGLRWILREETTEIGRDCNTGIFRRNTECLEEFIRICVYVYRKTDFSFYGVGLFPFVSVL